MFIVVVVIGSTSAHAEDLKPAKYVNYRDMLYAMVASVGWKGIPEDLQRKMVACTVDVVIEAFTPAELAHLDDYARGDAALTAAEGSALDRKIEDRLGNDGGLSVAKQKCPDTVSQVAAWRAAHGQE